MKVRVLAEVLGVLALLGSTVIWYHTLDQEAALSEQRSELITLTEENAEFQGEIKEQLDELTINAVVERLGRLIPIRCNPRPESTIPEKWQALLLRYHQLTGVEYDAPPCP